MSYRPICLRDCPATIRVDGLGFSHVGRRGTKAWIGRHDCRPLHRGFALFIKRWSQQRSSRTILELAPSRGHVVCWVVPYSGGLATAGFSELAQAVLNLLTGRVGNGDSKVPQVVGPTGQGRCAPLRASITYQSARSRGIFEGMKAVELIGVSSQQTAGTVTKPALDAARPNNSDQVAGWIRNIESGDFAIRRGDRDLTHPARNGRLSVVEHVVGNVRQEAVGKRQSGGPSYPMKSAGVAT